ncbi:MAG: co-chaperone DjlA [Cycloclasticus sp.]|jgi:DnaJ like chaperone protein|nr:MAG: molecular chaperone DjlA [Cycloclasticus sp. Phe_18]MBV1913037.1 co-chaperone DjlA [Cycloclasticus sp.]MDF1689280.1 co-chaperone DjlA [Cycloclasticus sp.]MEE4292175.1 co-chaperone DjlA [Cycloclasticus sp.]
MRWTGKLLGGVFGYMAFGTLGALLGVYIGHKFDTGMAQNPFDPARQQRIKKTFFKSTFAIMGHIAKADGQVSQEEIQMAKRVMAQMELSASMQNEAIAEFNRGKGDGFNLDAELEEFKQACQHQKNLIRMFIEVQLQAAFADGVLDDTEDEILQHICGRLGIPQFAYEQLKRMLGASQRRGTHQQSRSTPEEAYAILGVSESASDAEVKKAYRRLISQHHPDKLVSKGLPDEMMKIAKEKTQQITEAYDTIREMRKQA